MINLLLKSRHLDIQPSSSGLLLTWSLVIWQVAYNEANTPRVEGAAGRRSDAEEGNEDIKN